MADEIPEHLTTREVRPASAKVLMVVLADGRIYKREGDRWRCLDYERHRNPEQWAAMEDLTQ